MSDLKNIHDYYTFCDALHQEWLNHQFKNETILNEVFQMEYSPEPYFVLKNGNNPLYMLLTNPGSGMEFQHISNLKNVTYSDFSKILADIYTSEAFKKEGGFNAHRRLINSIKFSEYLGFNSLVNIETIPFHSSNLNKKTALNTIGESFTLFAYQERLKNYLREKPVLIVSACGTKESININSIKNNPWLLYQTNLANIEIDNLKIKPLTIKNKKVTSALFSYENKYIVLMMGSNNLPSMK